MMHIFGHFYIPEEQLQLPWTFIIRVGVYYIHQCSYVVE